MFRYGWWLLFWIPAVVWGGKPELQLALREGSQNVLFMQSPNGQTTQQPLPNELDTTLGSIWKLFVYAYLVDNQWQEPDYRCNGSQPQEEVYCCETGKSIGRDQALVQSCGLYFNPQRLQLDQQKWANYWQHIQSPNWLQDLAQLKPETKVPVSQLLDVLASLPAQQQARNVLLDVLLTEEGVLTGTLGSRLRIKTWSWKDDNNDNQRQGGFAGWLNDGTPVWARGAGTSKMVLHRHADDLNTLLPQALPVDNKVCVVVKFFDRYPILAVRKEGDSTPAMPGPLQGKYLVEFHNGNQLKIESHGELYLQQDGDKFTITAQLDRENYVARVLQREAAAQPIEAAKALAIAIRSYLQQNASRSGDCLLITDSSASQRVSALPASQAAMDIASWTADLVLAGAPVNYHNDQAGNNRLSWQLAVNQAQQGMRYDAILAKAFPRANLGRWDKPEIMCQPLPEAENWIAKQQYRWREKLNSEPGYSPLNQFTVCRLVSGKPHVDRTYGRIYIRDLYSLQDRLDLTHEYLHLAFAAHPNGMDEVFVEQLARQLLLE